MTQKHPSLFDLACSYIGCLNKVGSTDPDHIREPHFSAIWAENCQKIMNRDVLYQEGRFFLEQLRDVRKLAGKWQVDLKETITDNESHMCAIRYDLKSEHFGTFQVSAFLTFDDQGLLAEINEVCCKV